MMRIINFAKRNLKEIIRDPLSLIFSILLPLFLLFLFQQIEIPGDNYKIENFAPGIVIFSFGFLTLFTATLVSKDYCGQFLIRLSTSPMKEKEYILGYILAILPILLIQNILFYGLGIVYGLKINIYLILSIIVSIPISILFITLGILIGISVSDKTAPGLSSVLVQLIVFTSGMYFPSKMLGKGFRVICKILPFESGLNILKSTLNATNIELISSIIIFTIYTVVVFIITIITFKRKINNH